MSRSKEEGSWEVGGRELDLREEKGVVQVQKRRKSRGWRSGIGPGRGEESGPGPKKKEVGSWRSEIGPEKQEGGALGPKNQEEKLFWIWEGRRELLRPKKEAGQEVEGEELDLRSKK